MPLSTMFESLTRMLSHVEKNGYEGFKLWKSKQSKKKETIGYALKDLKHKIYLRTASSDYAIYRQIFIEKQYEYSLKQDPKIIIDCGANIGLASVYFANKYPSAKIIAIEPETSNFELLVANTKNYPNVHCLKNGIWHKKTNLHIYDAGMGSWNFVTNEVDYENENTISAISLTDIMVMFKIERIDILKMDIEGSEKEVFDNYDEAWLNNTDLVIIETHDRMKKGTAKSFFTAISSFNYSMDVRGENIFCELSPQ
jgi:FkbM family methyltransferase